MELHLGRGNAQPWHAHTPADASDIVVQVTDILYEYLPPNSGVSPELAVQRVQDVMNSNAGMAAYVTAAMHSNAATAEDVVAQIADVLDASAPNPKEMISQLLEVVDSPLALEVYDREMERRRPRDADRWH
jgi:hypothetical protein